ncbi:MAG: toll/interleukin-1 receptor domain-containing protein [Verrucomicrobiales bacterium]|nr:toll/interleukin-1 receptor domain-containing protein [Verrucomicrobiales bacterium]
MNPLVADNTDLRKLLFISYAYEDQVFAKWLARKLALYGYGVWIDQIEILGGESWVKEVDVAIKERSFRVLGLLSKTSIGKENPRKERTLALQLAKQRKTDDFLVTLNLDGSQPDWTLSDISWISFRESWADGLRRLLKKLQSLNAPRIHAGNSAIAKAALDRGASLLAHKSEPLTTNLLPFIQVPDVLRIIDISDMDEGPSKASFDLWPHYRLEQGRAGAFSPPPAQFTEVVKETRAALHWPSYETIQETPTQNLVSRLLNRSVHSWLIRAGCVLAEDRSGYYLPAPFRAESIYRFKDVDGSSSYIRVAGSIRLYRPNSAPEEVIHHPAIRYAIRKNDWGSFVIQLRPGVVLFDGAHKLITGRRVGPRTKKVTRAYFNEKWRKRLMAFTQLLTQAAIDDKESVLKLGSLIAISTDRSLDEALLAGTPVSEVEDSAHNDVHVSAEEMEDANDE